MVFRIVSVGLLALTACGGETESSGPEAYRQAVVAEWEQAGLVEAAADVEAPPSAPGTPFLMDTVEVQALRGAGWQCELNVIENMDCNRAIDVEGIGEAQISVMPTPQGQISIINVTATQSELTGADSVTLGEVVASLAAEHGWSCFAAGDAGVARPCTKDGSTIQIETFPNEGYAMASVRAPELDGQLGD